MTAVYKTYDISFFETTLWDGFHFEVPPTAMKLISELADKVGAPNYVKTPIFTKSTNALQQKRRKNDGGKHQDINEEDWMAIRNFKATNIAKSEGVQKTIDDARGFLNKMSEKNYAIMSEKILDIIKENENGGTFSQEDTFTLISYIFNTASGNTFCSELYARLIVDLLAHSPTIKDMFHKNKTNFVNRFDDIISVNPEEDYDKFCENNILNEKRKASSMFLINLMKLGVIIPQEIINIIHTLQEHLLEVLEQDNKCEVAEEITENLFILMKGGYSYISKLGDWNVVINRVEVISKMKSNSKPSLRHKCIFKHMDILDAIKKMKR